MVKQRWYVRLGETEWSRHTYARPDGDRLQLLGSVRHGAGVGALAIASDGTYLQVNGDYERPLSKGRIRQALAKATSDAPAQPRQRSGPQPRPAVVIVKRRRLPGIA